MNYGMKFGRNLKNKTEIKNIKNKKKKSAFYL